MQPPSGRFAASAHYSSIAGRACRGSHIEIGSVHKNHFAITATYDHCPQVSHRTGDQCSADASRLVWSFGALTEIGLHIAICGASDEVENTSGKLCFIDAAGNLRKFELTLRIDEPLEVCVAFDSVTSTWCSVLQDVRKSQMYRNCKAHHDVI